MSSGRIEALNRIQHSPSKTSNNFLRRSTRNLRQPQLLTPKMPTELEEVWNRSARSSKIRANYSYSLWISFPTVTDRCDKPVRFLPLHRTTRTDVDQAVEALVPYSLSQPAIFKTNELLPVKDLKLLVRDYKVGDSVTRRGT